MTRRCRILLTVVGTLAVLLLVLWVWNQGAVVREETAPDYLQLGHVYAGSTVEFSARFLVSSHRHPLDTAFERILKWAPQSWTPAFSKLHPKNLRSAPATIDPATLKPSIQAPAFIRVQNTTPELRTNWYQGRPFVTLEMALDTSRAGDFSGEVEVTMDRRKAALPVRVTVRERRVGVPQLLIASTPFESYATEHGAHFEATTALMALLPLDVNYLQKLPPQLEPYQVILLADSALVRLDADEISRLGSFVEKGGRLILACNAFMVGSVVSANQILADRGMQVLDKDYGRHNTVTNIAPDRLTRGVRRAEFHRASLIEITDTSKAKSLALAPDGEGGFVAVSRTRSGGEIVVLTSSLWWNWLHEFKTTSDNAQLMRILLAPDKTE